MSSNNKVVWSEGLFLRPQHFQQQDRYVERFVEGRAAALRSYSWGFTEVQIERDLLAIGKLGLKRASGIFPDGTPFSMPDDDPLPAPLELTAQIRDKAVALAIPVRKSGVRESDRRDVVDGVVRYRTRDVDTRDVTSDSNALHPLDVACLRSKLLLAGEPQEDFATIPVAHILECRADRMVVLDDRFIPTVLNARQTANLATFMTEVQGLLHQRGDALAARAVASGRSGSAEIADFLMLQAVNRYEPLITHWAQASLVHPEDLYRLCLEIVGDLSTLTTEARRPPKFPVYQHGDLRATYEPVMAALRACFAVVLKQNAVQIPLEKKRFNISVGVVADRGLFDDAAFILAARADVPAETVRRDFPAQVTLAAVEKIAKLVNEHIPGIPIQPLSVAPRQIPFHAGLTYFELDRGSPLFRELKSGGGIALHVPDSFPGLTMELWAIRA
ncbi:MAG TPA: type VI secretion system baseplate subunit TssK [Steroidobacteraceae bacterium]|jgi:type VI secretion system protein ImpJ